VSDTSIADAPTRSWWRANARPLVVVAVLLPALVFVLLGLPLIDIADREPSVIEVAYGDTVEAAGFSWTVDAAAEFVGEGADTNGIPNGAAIAAAILLIEPVDGSAVMPAQDYCTAELSRRTGVESEQHWMTLSSPALYDYGLSDASTDFCSLHDRESVQLESVFLTPEGTFAEATLDITFIGEPTILRFALHEE